MEYTYATGSVPSYAGRISGRKTRVRDGIGFDVTNHSYTYDAMGRLAEVTLKHGTREVPTLPSFPSLGAVTLAADSLTLGDIYPLNTVRPTLTFPADNSESFTYDLNANLLTISRKGKDDAGSYRVVDENEMGYIGNQFVDV